MEYILRLTYRQVAALWERYSCRMQWEIELSIKTNPMYTPNDDDETKEETSTTKPLLTPGRGGIDTQDPEWDHSIPTLDATQASARQLSALGLNVRTIPKASKTTSEV